MPKRLGLVLASALLVHAFTPSALAQDEPSTDTPTQTTTPSSGGGGHSIWGGGDLSIGLQIGPSIYAATQTGGSTTAVFSLFTDFEYHINPEWGLVAGVDLGINDFLFLGGASVGARYHFQLGAAHDPYLAFRGGFRIGHFFDHGGSFTDAGAAVHFGGGYRYFVDPRIGIGVDVGFVPSVFFANDAHFVFGVNISFGLEIKL